jgi:hypothetical protein
MRRTRGIERDKNTRLSTTFRIPNFTDQRKERNEHEKVQTVLPWSWISGRDKNSFLPI